MTDKDRLDWLAQNFFHSEMDDIDKKLHPNQTAWRFFGLKNDQGDIRKIIDNAMNHEGYQQTDNESDIVKDAERYRYLKNNNAQIIAVENERRGYRSTDSTARPERWFEFEGWGITTVSSKVSFPTMDEVIDYAMENF